jgi:hypothetical protein
MDTFETYQPPLAVVHVGGLSPTSPRRSRVALASSGVALASSGVALASSGVALASSGVALASTGVALATAARVGGRLTPDLASPDGWACGRLGVCEWHIATGRR